MNNKCVVLNAKKINFDGKIDFSILSSDVRVYDDTTEQQMLERIQGADIIVTKEMPVSAEMIQKFPESVQLICEAGTGYNNIDLEAARKRKITVCNIPAYSTERVAHTTIMMILNLSSTMQVQMKMLGCGNHDNFTKNLQVPHVEVNGKTLGVIGAGHIGRKVIQIAQALDMNILVYSRTPREETEPPVASSPLYTMDNVILTPHMGWKGLETRQRLVSILADNIKSFIKGNPINVVSNL